MQNHNAIAELVFALSTGLFRYLGPVRLALFVRNGGQVLLHDPTSLCPANAYPAGLVDSFLEDSSEWPSPDHLVVRSEIAGSSLCLLWILERTSTLINVEPIIFWLKHAGDVIRAVERNPFLDHRELFSHREALASFGAASVKSATEAETRQFKRIHPIDVVLSLSLTYEEGKKCSGNIAFIQNHQSMNGLLAIKFDTASQPSLHSPKHLRKFLISVEHSDYWLVSDLERVIGVSNTISGIEAASQSFPGSVIARFVNGRAEIWCQGVYLCSAFEGQLMSRRATPQKETVLAALLSNTPQEEANTWAAIVTVIWPLIEFVYQESAGCSLVLDIAETPDHLAGEYLAPPLALKPGVNLEIASRMAKIDGALHIARSGILLGFACLLDGIHVQGEDRSRGARFNSAVRFTASHNDKAVLTVSSDGPISCFYKGKNVLRHSFPIQPGFVFRARP